MHIGIDAARQNQHCRNSDIEGGFELPTDLGAGLAPNAEVGNTAVHQRSTSILGSSAGAAS
jgi:hypothetical protein